MMVWQMSDIAPIIEAMTHEEAQEKVARLEALHPWIGDYDWTVREAADGEWVVVKVAVTPETFLGRAYGKPKDGPQQFATGQRAW